MDNRRFEEISRMVKEYTRVNSSTPAKARAALIKEGIYTKSGRLAKKYGGGRANQDRTGLGE